MTDIPLLDPSELAFVILGASAVGKSTFAERLCELGITEATPTWTTRQQRPGEQEAPYDHHFATDEEFDRMREEQGFIAVKSFYGARYGVPKLHQPAEGKEALMVLKPTFMEAFREYYGHAQPIHIVSLPVLLPERMRDRGQSQADIDVRMSHHGGEVADATRLADGAHTFLNNVEGEAGIQLVTRLLIEQIHADRAAHDAAARLRA